MTKHEAVEILEEVKTLDDSMFAYSQAYNDALEMAIEALKAQKSETSDAPKPDDNVGCWYDITHNYTLEQVVSALKAQEPRVMTLEEVLRLKFDDVVFFEMPIAGVVISAIVIDVIEHMPDGDIGLIQFRHIQEPINNADLEYYGKTWRCWTSRPDEKRREETPCG